MAETPAMPQIRRRRRHADEPGWYEAAVAARHQLENTPRGERNTALAAIGAQYGRRPDTLRRFIGAAAFVDRLKDKDLSTALMRLPVAGVELVARWWAYDPTEARRAANGLTLGSYTIETLRAAEKQAREVSKVLRWGRAGHHALRTRISSDISQMVQIKDGPAFVPDKPKQFDPRRLDFLFRSETDENYRVAVLLFGPFQDEEIYWTRQDEFLLNILGLSKMYTKVVGIIPSDRIFSEFEAWLNHVDDPNITFHYVNQKDGTFYSPRAIHSGHEPPHRRRD